MSLLPAGLGASCAHLERVHTYVNPLDVFLGDPFVLLHGNQYYLYATSSGHGFKVWSSPDMVNWQLRGMAYAAAPDSYGKACFWAPEVVFHGGRFIMHYTAQGADGILRICVAESPSPLGPFIDTVAPMFDTGDGKAWIDGHVFRDEDGSAWLYVSKDHSRNNQQSQIFAAKLKSSLRELDGPLSFCIGPEGRGTWEGTGWNEGAFVLKNKGAYYLMYSASFYGSPNYAVGYATASHPLGPWKKYEGNPILKKVNGKVSGPGHHSVTRSIDGSEMFVCYHTHQSFAGGGARQLAIDRLHFEADPQGGPDLLKVAGPTSTPHSYPSKSPAFPRGASDDFQGSSLDRNRWLVFGEVPERWDLTPEGLEITALEGDIWSTNTGEANNIFLQYAPERDFSVRTSVRFQPEADYEQAFLVVWQDHNNYLRLARSYSDGQKIQVTHEVGGAVQTVLSVPAFSGEHLELRIDRKGDFYRFFASPGGAPWIEIGSGILAPLLERKVGIGAIAPDSKAARKAIFRYFRLER